MSRTVKPAGQKSPALRFRAEIEQAVAEGVDREDLRLRLTHRDASLLRRDPKLPVSDISFAGGSMRFLGVRIEEGGVERSELVRS
jgi:hypothetical protein